NATLLGPPIYAERLNGIIVFNTTAHTTSADPRQVGKAKVYFLSTTLTPPVDSLPELLFNDTSLSFLSAAINRTNFYDSAILAGGASYTLLAPVNDAFRNAGYDSVGAIDSASYSSVVQLLANQFVRGSHFSARFPSSVQRLQGSDLIVSYNGGIPQFTTGSNPNPVHLLSSDLVAGSDLIIHYTDGILSP
ncbi:MAG: fasciclin domain-containing protein, partial [Bacteroidetes bacterium]|nr:fasciclin domain-containing protein [Bacteroidota bacterium]